jgi:PEP-CTERM motif
MKPMFKRFSAVAVAAFLAVGMTSGHAANVAEFSFTSQSLSPSLSAANVSVGAVNFTGSMATIGNFVGDANVLGFVGTFSATDYFQFSVTPDAGYQLDLSSLSFRAAATLFGTGAQVRSSVDGFTANLASIPFLAGYSGTTNLTTYSADLSGAAFQDLTASTTFRIYSTDAADDAAVYDSLALAGSVAPITAPVPEPETYAMLLAGLGVLGWVGRRKQRAA